MFAFRRWTWLGSSVINLGELKRRIGELEMSELKWIIHHVTADFELFRISELEFYLFITFNQVKKKKKFKKIFEMKNLF